MPFIPKDERPSLALIAGLEDEQAAELSGALRAASDELGGDELVQKVVNGTPSIDADDVKKILEAVRQIASAKEVLEIQQDVFLSDMAKGMGDIEEHELRLDETRQRRLRERLAALTESPAVEIHAKARSLRQDRENTYCTARIVTDLRPIFGSDAPRADQRANLRQRFDRYADEWRAQTAHTSVVARRIMHPSYQKIIGLGREALPLILDRLSSQPDHWFWALRSISDEDPVRPEDVGRFDAMRDAWIEWGRDRGLLR